MTTKLIAMKKKKATAQQTLAKTYYDLSDPAGYAGASKLKAKYPQADTKSWLTNQLAYTLHKPMRRTFPTRKYKVSGMNDLWQIDLMEMIPYASINDGYRYIITCIDVFSRYARAEPVKAKDAKSVAAALERMLQKDEIPTHIQTDLGKEFYNSKVKDLFIKYKIKHYSVYSQFKAALVERFNRTLRSKLNRYFTHNNSKKWLDALPKIIRTYNKTPHRSLHGKRPIDMCNNLDYWLEQENELVKVPKSRKPYDIGNYVRISRLSANPFRKNFDQNWSEEVFRIIAVDTKVKPIMYVIEDLTGEVIQGKFYHEELQDLSKSLPTVFRIEQVLDTRGRGKHKQYLVKWLGYNHNTWIDSDQFLERNV